MKLRTLLFAALLISSTTSLAAQNACVDLFIDPAEQSEAVRQVVVADGYQQWLLWEQRANVVQFRKQTNPVDVELVEMSPENVTIRTIADAPADLINAFRTSDGNILWAKHPYNTHKDVPYRDLKGADRLQVYLTASRSLALDGRLRGFTIKLATNFPHGPHGERQDGKIKTNEDIASALIHTNHMKKVDAVMGADNQLLMMGEVMTMADKKTGIGMVVRDVRLLADGHYYLPALSIPHVGREIAALNGTSFETFFQKYYAELLGEAKARLLLRYGLQMETPNSQNMLIQFDRQMRPTGKIVFRDVSDSFLVDAVATGLGYSGQIKRDMAVHYRPVKEIKPFWSNSSWRFDEAGDKAVTEAVLNQWGQAHDRAYVKYIEKELGLDFNLSAKDLVEDVYPSVYRVLSTDIGQRKLRQYRDRMIETERARRRAQADAPARAS